MLELHPNQRLLNLKDLSEIYRMPLSTLRRWAAEDKFPLYRISNRVKVDIVEWEKWLKEHRNK